MRPGDRRLSGWRRLRMGDYFERHETWRLYSLSLHDFERLCDARLCVPTSLGAGWLLALCLRTQPEPALDEITMMTHDLVIRKLDTAIMK